MTVLAKEFGIGISTVSVRVSKVSEKVRKTAAKVADANAALDELPVRLQAQAISLAEKLRNISNSLASAAELGADTADRLSKMANDEVKKVTSLEDGQSLARLKNVGVLAKLSNESASLAAGLVASNKEAIARVNSTGDEVDPSEMAPAFNVTITG